MPKEQPWGRKSRFGHIPTHIFTYICTHIHVHTQSPEEYSCPPDMTSDVDTVFVAAFVRLAWF